jgi:hypothetical protein
MQLSLKKNFKEFDEKGFVLISTLGIMIILSVMAAAFSLESRIEAKISSRQKNDIIAFYIARAGIHRNAAIVRSYFGEQGNGPSSKWWKDTENYREIKFQDMVYSIFNPGLTGQPVYGLDDEESRLNINIASPEMLMELTGITSSLAEEIVLYRTKKLENDQVTQDSDNMISGPITDIKELLNIRGLTPEILYGNPDDPYSPIRNLTCYSSGKININSARQGTLLCLGFAPDQVDRILVYRKLQNPPETSLEQFFDKLGFDINRFKKTLNLMTVKSCNFRMICSARRPEKKKPAVTISARLSILESSMFFSLWDTIKNNEFNF